MFQSFSELAEKNPSFYFFLLSSLSEPQLKSLLFFLLCDKAWEKLHLTSLLRCPPLSLSLSATRTYTHTHTCTLTHARLSSPASTPSFTFYFSFSEKFSSLAESEDVVVVAVIAVVDVTNVAIAGDDVVAADVAASGVFCGDKSVVDAIGCG